MSLLKRPSLIRLTFLLIKQLSLADCGLKLYFLASLVIGALSIITHLTIPLIFKNITNLLAEQRNFIPFLFIGYGILWILSQAIIQIRTFLINILLERSMHILSIKVVDHLFSLSLRFHQDKQTGSLVNQIHRAQSAIDSIFWGFISCLLPTGIEIILFTLLVGYLYGFFYSGLIGIIIAVYLFLSTLAIQKAVDAYQKYNEKRIQTNSRLADSILNFETVKYFGNEALENLHISTMFKEQEQAGKQRYLAEIRTQTIQIVIIGLCLTCITLRSGYAVYTNIINIGDFLLINSYLLQFFLPLNNVGYIIHHIRRGLHDLHNLYEILLTKPEITDAVQAVNLITHKAEVVFDKVCFGYTRDHLILKNVSFAALAGKITAIVGPTGSGKSTIARLLFRFYDVNNGQITINNHDIRCITQQSLHSTIGMVPQDILLFNDTLYYNITYGKIDVSKEELDRVITLAHLDSLINSLPKGYNTIVGERGVKLSGGERQRVAIARMLLKQTSICIFDEATSSLDTLTECKIQENIQKVSKHKTTIIITHRLSAVTQADQIIVLHQGAVLESGAHAWLLQYDGLYAHLWHEQMHKEM